MANNSNCLPMPSAFYGPHPRYAQLTSARPLPPRPDHPAAMRRTSITGSLHTAGGGSRWSPHCSSGPQGAMQVFKQGCGTIRGVLESPLWHGLIKGIHALDQSLANYGLSSHSQPTTCVCTSSFIRTDTLTCLHTVHGMFLHHKGRVEELGYNIWPKKPKIFTVSPFMESWQAPALDERMAWTGP